MKNHILIKLAPIYTITLLAILFAAFLGNKGVAVLSQNPINNDRVTIIIDAGHGGIDTGATSYTGRMESDINLEISLKLRDLFNLLGYKTKMIRTTDISVFTEGTTIAAKKISDLKNRVQIVNSTNNAILVSIHQNYFAQKKYKGAQIFYNRAGESEKLAKLLQSNIVATINPGSNRLAKKANNVYLMENIHTTGILVECGFLSNPQEEHMLLDARYQKQLCCVIAATISTFLNAQAMT